MGSARRLPAFGWGLTPVPYADPEARRAAWRRHYERRLIAVGKTPRRLQERPAAKVQDSVGAFDAAPARRKGRPALALPELPETASASALQPFERMTRAEVARRLGITRQAVEQAEKSGLKKLIAARAEFEGFL